MTQLHAASPTLSLHQLLPHRSCLPITNSEHATTPCNPELTLVPLMYPNANSYKRTRLVQLIFPCPRGHTLLALGNSCPWTRHPTVVHPAAVRKRQDPVVHQGLPFPERQGLKGGKVHWKGLWTGRHQA